MFDIWCVRYFWALHPTGNAHDCSDSWIHHTNTAVLWLVPFCFQSFLAVHASHEYKTIHWLFNRKWREHQEIHFLQSRWTKQVRVSLLPYPHSSILETWSLSKSLQACRVQPVMLLVQDEWVPLHRHAHSEQEISNRLDPCFFAYSKDAVRCEWRTWRNNLQAHQNATDYSQQWHLLQAIYSTRAHVVGFYIVGAWVIHCWGNYTAVGSLSPSVSMHLSL